MILPLVLALLLQPPAAIGAASAEVERSRAIAREAELARSSAPIDANARTALNAILAQRAFSRMRTESWQAQLSRHVRDWLTGIWERTFGRVIGRRSVATTLAWTAAAAALIFLIVWLVNLASPGRRERPISMGPLDVPRRPGHLLAQEAEALIRAGHIRDAIRVAYQAGVSRLDEVGALRADETRTPRESLRLLDDGNRRRPAFARLTTIFERAWYGSRPPAADSGDEVLRLLRDLECLSFDRAK